MVFSPRAPTLAPFVITLSVSEQQAVSLAATGRFSMSNTPFLSLTMQLRCKANAEPSSLELCWAAARSVLASQLRVQRYEKFIKHASLSRIYFWFIPSVKIHAMTLWHYYTTSFTLIAASSELIYILYIYIYYNIYKYIISNTPLSRKTNLPKEVV